ncbi:MULTISPECIES: 5'/3'-nucleotidase SurE [Photorhabdus]|uniref:5'-nucleotidase n=2 Tax=Photorhabdus asymbiotica TaxID=291112 RepID=C7BLP0_PHOAA|nr:5'/3'-nucleotidase SurE [Photorhabdus asymbiotica]RKS57157.1 5'-nucleotidase [Photorhabdus asymbiotica]CAQ84487.1 5'-nucleotidase SurE (nucleoside 5'-monophosphate phosphohydrolase) [Photorhabdus asymbiotica]
MKIVIVNDDGYEEPFHHDFVDHLKKLAFDVISVTPSKNMSGFASAINIRNYVQFTEYESQMYKVDGTSVDCALIGIGLANYFWGKPDLLVSGINRGMNYGPCVIYSGTYAAARESSRQGILAVSFSANETNSKLNRRILDSATLILEKILSDKFDNKNAVLNVNFNSVLSDKLLIENEVIDKSYNLFNVPNIKSVDKGIVKYNFNKEFERLDFFTMIGLIHNLNNFSISSYDYREFKDWLNKL